MEPTANPLIASAQKEIERRHLHSFRCLSGDFPIGELTCGETPDFLVRTPTGRKIGIEHTQVFKTPTLGELPEQADEASKKLITDAAKGHAEFLGLPPAYVTLFFNPPYLRRTVDGKLRSLTKSQRQKVAEDIAAFVGAHMPPEGGSVECDWRPGQPRQVDLIQISRYNAPDRHNWRWIEMNAIQSEAIEQIQDAITKKDNRYNACVSQCDECWLLIVADSFLSSGNIHPDGVSLSHIYTSPFSRVYFLDLVLGQVSLLSTKSGP